MIEKLKPAIGLAAALLLGAPAFAGDTCPCEEATECEACSICEDGCEEEEVSCDWLNRNLLGECLSERTGLSIYGWFEGGSTFSGQEGTSLLPVGFNDVKTDFMLNQLYGVIERTPDTDKLFDVGGRIDLLYGTDADNVSFNDYGLGSDQFGVVKYIRPGDSFSGLYGFTLPQLYADLYLGVGPGVTFTVGHFYTLIGYEVVTAPDNFFYSHAYTMQYGEPFTHTGVLASSDLTDKLSVSGGITRGWDNWQDQNNDLGLLGFISYQATEKINIAWAFTNGEEQIEPRYMGVGLPTNTPGGGPIPRVNRFMYSLVIDVNVTDKIEYVFQHDYGIDSAATNTPEVKWYGINQYAYYTVNDALKLGVRGEWFSDLGGARVPGAAPTAANGIVVPGGVNNGANFYEVTVGANYSPVDCMTIRPELRWDWNSNDNGTAAFSNMADSLFTFGTDFILQF
ncbi:hypothetical protein Pan216_52810 [Planctomycetes bacterium Pan216]|uniref:Porin n=1 Tax=Kolteria novifilia TaxID=2527975 RepID=A0A518BBM3_9BACT|nr:hypothetical protein Pan216_52810 [Planctomycetes bacterium Pan216]